MSNLKNKIDKGITEFYLNSDIELIKKSLEEDGVDVTKESTEISNFLKRLKFTQNAVATQENDQALIARIVEKFQDAINKNIEKPIATLISLVETKQMSVQFRNLDKLTPDEIKEIIKGKNLVDLMDELDNEES
ncbi:MULTISPECIES: hypothetical protein [Flagellimonas]|uniref:Uncharacterized protein n=2 Tax=Flagellimonas TaxID=444459 RepID=A0ABT5XRN5_9FLAO|nr:MULTISPECIES: hypothetical protein [Allomuricauda]MBO0356197.1 hypothetical protein [Allomuricauda aurea]MDF0708554.1 hypothetical protein [[Muricauda] okinawensis]